MKNLSKAFKKGDYVTVKELTGRYEVRNGMPDKDGEISVYDNSSSITGSKSWSYVPLKHCTTFIVPQENSNKQLNLAGNSEMANQKITRNLVRVALVDEDAGLDVSKSLVKEFGTFVTEGSNPELIQEILMDTQHNVESVLRGHNAMRIKEVDLDILQRTGNTAKLREVKLKDLTWKVTAA